MLFFQNTAVVGGLLGENVQLNLKVWRFPSLCNANNRRLEGHWRLMDAFRDARSRDARLRKHRECLKRIHFYRVGVSWLSLREPQIYVDQLGVLTAPWLMRGGDGRCWETCCREQVNTGEARSCPTSSSGSSTRTARMRVHPHPLFFWLFSRGLWAAGRHQLWFRSNGFKIRSTPKGTCSESWGFKSPFQLFL